MADGRIPTPGRERCCDCGGITGRAVIYCWPTSVTSTASLPPGPASFVSPGRIRPSAGCTALRITFRILSCQVRIRRSILPWSRLADAFGERRPFPYAHDASAWMILSSQKIDLQIMPSSAECGRPRSSKRMPASAVALLVLGAVIAVHAQHAHSAAGRRGRWQQGGEHAALVGSACEFSPALPRMTPAPQYRCGRSRSAAQRAAIRSASGSGEGCNCVST